MNSRKIKQNILSQQTANPNPFGANVSQKIHAKYSNITDPVGLIQLDGESLCTGFLVGQRNLMSAGHCDQMDKCRQQYEEYGADRYQVVFGYDQEEKDRPSPHAYSVKEIKGFYKCNDSYDVASFKLSSDAAYKQFGKLQLQEPYIKKQKIMVPHHPNGQTKKLSAGNVVAYYPQVGLFGHTANTLPGSSGAPVVSENSGNVIGVHVSGGKKENYALPSTTILAALKPR